MFDPNTHYESIMRAFRGQAGHVERPEQLIRPALERAVASGEAACINVEVDLVAPYPTG